MNELDYIIGYETLYKINRNGEVWSCRYKKFMSLLETNDGYFFVNLVKDKVRKKCRIHRLLALQYIPNPNNLAECDHIDRNKKNNNIENLRWVTRTENRHNQDRYETSKLRTDEGKEEREKEIREYKRVWAEKDRKEKGIQPKGKKWTDEEEKIYKHNHYLKQKEKLNELTDEEKKDKKDKMNARRRELRAEKKGYAVIQLHTK